MSVSSKNISSADANNTNNNANNNTPLSNEFNSNIPYKYFNMDNGKMDDGDKSEKSLTEKDPTSYEVSHLTSEEKFRGIYHSAGLFDRGEIDLFNKRYRYGIMNPYDALVNCREYLFFTKPDLNIYPRDDNNGLPSSTLDSYLQTKPFWLDLAENNLDVIKCLQSSLSNTGSVVDPFNHLLENMVQSNLDTPTISSEMIETPSNMYGVNYTYHGSSEASDDGFDFSLEFKDTRYLQVYKFFKAYEDYETIKHHGQLKPWNNYIINKILYDQYCIYKFLVGDDGETIVYYAKFYGVKSKSLPREVFSNTSFDNGLSYSIDFNAAFFDDMKPSILMDFNYLSKDLYNSRKYDVHIYNNYLDRPDNRPVKAAYVFAETSSQAPGGKVYKLKWKGDDAV